MRFKFLLAVLLVPVLVSAFSMYMKGEITASVNVDSMSLGAQFGPEFIRSAQGSISLPDGSGSIAFLQLNFRFNNNFTSGDVQLQGYQNSGSASLTSDAVDDVLSVSSFSWSSGKTLLGEWELSENIEKTFEGDLRFDGRSVGFYSLRLKTDAIDEGSVVFSEGGSSISFDSKTERLLSDVNFVTNSFSGFVYDREGNPVVSGDIHAVSGDFFSTAKIVQVGSRGGFGFGGNPIVVSGPKGSSVTFFVNDKRIKTLQLSDTQSSRLIELNVDVARSPLSFSDLDKDGVPDELDECPDSFKEVVNAQGCTCGQIMRIHNGLGRCVVTADRGPVWIPPPPPPRPEPQCEEEYRNSCLPDLPKFCDNDLQVKDACGVCGCDIGFSCGEELNMTGPGSQSCYNTVDRNNLTCFSNEYHFGSFPDCSQFGETFIDVVALPNVSTLDHYITAYAQGNFWAKGKSERKARKEAQRWLGRQRLCINSIDLGCVSADAVCPGEREFYAAYDDAVDALDDVLEQNYKRPTYDAAVWSTASARGKHWMYGIQILAIPFIMAVNAIGSACCGEVDVFFDVNRNTLPDFPSRIESPCNTGVVQEGDECKSIANRGHVADRFDLYMLGDGFDSDDEFEEVVEVLLDSDRDDIGTVDEGLFSIEPFGEKRYVFNVWSKNVVDMDHEKNERRPGHGFLPKRSAVESEVLSCEQRDLTVVISKKQPYKSQCVTSKLCFLSLPAEPFPGRSMIKLVGESFGLADESYFNITEFTSPREVTDFEHLNVFASNNCKKNREDAELSWGEYVEGRSVGFFDACGGDCDDSCADYVRPVYNSVMRNVTSWCDGGKSCRLGPPFDPFYQMHKDAIVERLLEFEMGPSP